MRGIPIILRAEPSFEGEKVILNMGSIISLANPQDAAV